jgi:hypothetical protein
MRAASEAAKKADAGGARVCFGYGHEFPRAGTSSPASSSARRKSFAFNIRFNRARGDLALPARLRRLQALDAPFRGGVEYLKLPSSRRYQSTT